MQIHAKRALIGHTWREDVRISVAGGRISRVMSGANAAPGDVVVDTVLPALGNVHSHAFQRAMAGMTERRAAGRESFWTWRDLMYRFLEQLTPEHVQAIAAMVQVEMLEAGYASVGEFHYLHHAPGGVPYGDPAEMSVRIMAAAEETGIGLCHLPVLYSRGGVDGRALEGGQRRFGNDPDRFLRLLDSCRAALSVLPPDARLGGAPHSLRAVDAAGLAVVVSAQDGPIHVHIAEQMQEVDDILAACGARPVEWLLAQHAVDARWCLIHATHMSATETAALAASGAVAGLCPITEANLGDGIFNAAAYLEAGGRFGIGSDSNLRIALGEELRLLEYGQRLRERRRAVLAPEGASVGRTLYEGAARGGALALGRDAGEIAPGRLADLVALRCDGPALCALEGDALLDGMVFAAPETVVSDVWAAGRHVVRDGRHMRREVVARRYCGVIAQLRDRL